MVNDLQSLIDELEEGRTNTRFDRLLMVCERFFGRPRIKGSHHYFKTPWPGDPRINVQRTKDGKAKPYQIDQVVKALHRLKQMKAHTK